MIYHLYGIRLPTDDYRIAYIGVSKQPRRRFIQHCQAPSAIGDAIRLCELDVVFEIIESSDDREHIYRREIEAIAALNTRWPSGYNLALGGFGGRDPLPSTLAKLSAAHLGTKQSTEVIDKRMVAHRGAKRSPEACANMAKAQRDKVYRPDATTREKMAAAHRGKKQSPGAIAKTATANRGRKYSSETLAKMSASHTGVKRTIEAREKQAAAVTGAQNHFFGRTHTAETRAKIAEKRAAQVVGPWSSTRRAEFAGQVTEIEYTRIFSEGNRA